MSNHWAMTASETGYWLEAERYAAALQAAAPLPSSPEAPVRLAPRETARLRTIATYQRQYPTPTGPHWGDRHGTAVVATTERLLVSHRLRGWISFWFKDIDSIEAGLDRQPCQLDLQWTHDDPALRMSGPTAPLLAVHVAAHTDPSGWASRTDLEPLLKPTRPPSGSPDHD